MNSNFDYTTRDFTTIRRELGIRARRALPDWDDNDASDFMNVLIDLWAYMGDVMHFYIDRAAREAFLSTATQRESVLALANLYDYNPRSMTSAKGSITFVNESGEDIYVPKGMALAATYNNSTYFFFTTEERNVADGSSETFKIQEGTEFTEQPLISAAGTEVSDGTPGQKFTLFHEDIDLSTLTIDVLEGPYSAPVRWRRVSRFTSATASDAVYVATMLADGTTQIQFGSGVNGRIPPTNLPIVASYVVCSGAAGNLPVNSVTTISSPGYGGLSIASSSTTTGGTDAESVASMKTAIPLAFRAQERAVTLTDFADIALGVSGVSKASAEYVAGSGTSGSVTIHAAAYQENYTNEDLSVTSLTLSKAVRDEILQSTFPVAMLGIGAISVPETVDLTTIYVQFTVEVEDGYLQQPVVDASVSAIKDYFAFDNVSFGQTVSVGDLYKRILAIDGVRHCTITGFNTDNTTTLLDNGKFAVFPDRLPHLGTVTPSVTGGITG